jgi:NAD(P)H-dependent FMN reductase
MKVLAISGSLRQESWNRKLLKLAVEVLNQRGVEVGVRPHASPPLQR